MNFVDAQLSPLVSRIVRGKIKTSVDMMELLELNKDSHEMVTLLEKLHTEKSPFYVISNLAFGYKKPHKLWQIDFIPLLSQENVYIGTFFYAKLFLFLSPLEYVDGIQPYIVTMQQPNDLFSRREWQVLFFMIHRLSSKEIARRLNISHITVDNKLQIIYQKADVHYASQLRVFCKFKGFDRYIPSELCDSSIHNGRRFVEMGGYCG